MSKANVYVVLASINSTHKDQPNVGLFSQEDAVRNRYIGPFEDIETRENEMHPSQGKWRFVTTPEDDWKPFGTFISLDEDHAVSVVHRTAQGFYSQAQKGAKKWLRTRNLGLSQGSEKISLHR